MQIVLALADGGPLAAALLSLPLGAQITVPGAELAAADPAAFDHVGTSVAVEGDLVLVGAPNDDDLGNASGSIHAFVRTAAGWAADGKLLAADGESGDDFGRSVALSGALAVVGAPGDDDLGSQAGAAYVFQRTLGGWTQVAKLHASNGAAADLFGSAVGISGARVVVGAPEADPLGTQSGAAYVFELGPAGWAQAAELVAFDGAAWDLFGAAVAISGERALVGAPADDDAGADSGAAYAFASLHGAWASEAKLAPAASAADGRFGESVALDGELALVGAYLDDEEGQGSGSATVFERGPGGWEEWQTLVPPTASEGGHFGWSVALSGERALVGGLQASTSPETGSVHLYEIDGPSWRHRGVLVAATPEPGDQFGFAVDLAGARAVVGATGADDQGSFTGAALAFDVPAAGCTQRDGVLGLDPVGYWCEEPPRLGSTWKAAVLQVPSVGGTVQKTFVVVALGGPVEGIVVAGFELLAAPPYAVIHEDAFAGLHPVQIPADLSLLGAEIATQGARIEIGAAGPIVVLLNAQDLVIGL